MGNCCSWSIDSGPDYSNYPKNVPSCVDSKGLSCNNGNNSNIEKSNPPLLNEVKFPNIVADDDEVSDVDSEDMNNYLKDVSSD